VYGDVVQDKVIMFANYLLSRKHTHLLKDVAALLQVLVTLTTSKVRRSGDAAEILWQNVVENQ